MMFVQVVNFLVFYVHGREQNRRQKKENTDSG